MKVKPIKLALFMALALLAGVVWASHAFSQGATSTQNCIPSYNATLNTWNCPPSWQPVLLNNLTGLTSVTSGQTKLGTVYCFNSGGAVAYIQLFDANSPSAVTLGTTKPKLSLGIPTLQASGVDQSSVGVAFQNGLVVASTTTATGSTTSAQDCNVTTN
jgi:hypothetical protein